MDLARREQPGTDDPTRAPLHTNHRYGDDSTMIAAAGAFFALGVVLWLVPFTGGELHWDGNVVNRAIVLGYDKSREVRLFILSCLLVPGLSGLLVALHRLQRRLGCRTPFVEGFIHLPLILWPAAVFYSRAHVGVFLLVPGLLYCCMRAILLRRCRTRFGGDTEPPPEAHETDQPLHETIRGFGIAAVILGAVGVSVVAGPLSTLPLTLKSTTLLALAAGILCLIIIRLMASLVPPGTRISERASVLRALLVLPVAGLVFTNLGPYDPLITGISIGVCVLLCFGVGIAAFRGRIVAADHEKRRLRIVSRVLWWGIAPAVLYAAVYVHDTTGPVDLYHEGERITPAEALAEGAAPYRDVFLWHGLFENGVKARIGLGLDGSVSGVRRVEHLLEPLEVVALYVLLSVCLRSPLYGLIAAVTAGYTLQAPHGRYWLAYLAYACITLWLIRDRRFPVFAGLAAGCSSLALFYSLDGGLAATVAVAAGLAYGWTLPVGPERSVSRFRGRSMGTAVIGFCAGAAIPLGYLAYHGSIGAWAQTAWDIAGGLSDRSSIPYPSLIRGIDEVVQNGVSAPHVSKIFALYLPPLVILWGLAHLAVRRISGSVNASSLALPVVVLGTALFFRAVIRRPDADHLGKILPLLLVVIAVILRHHLDSLRIRPCPWTHICSHGFMLGSSLLVGLWILTLDPETAPALNLAERSPRHELRGRDEPVREIRLERAGPGVVAHPGRATWLEHLVNLLSNRLQWGETFYDFTNRGLLYFLADRPCPVRYVQTTYAGSKRAQREVVEALRERRPRFVVFPSGNPMRYAYDHLIHPFRHPVITRFLYRTYAPWTTVGDAVILRLPDDGMHTSRRHALNFIRSSRFSVDLGHIPRLLGELPADAVTIRRWPAPRLAKSWRPKSEIIPLDSDDDILRIDTRSGGKLLSPRISLVPDPNHSVIIRLRSRDDGEARLLFGSEQHRVIDGSAALIFHVAGGDEIREYRVDAGLLPAWVWRGRIIRLKLEFGPETSLVDMAAVEIREYREENGN